MSIYKISQNRGMVVQDGAYGILSHLDQIRARYKAKSMHTEFWPLRADFHRVLIIEMLFPLTTIMSNREDQYCCYM